MLKYILKILTKAILAILAILASIFTLARVRENCLHNVTIEANMLKTSILFCKHILLTFLHSQNSAYNPASRLGLT